MQDSGDDNTDADRRIVAAQIGREPRAFARAAVRCVHGMPAVTQQHPTTEDGAPFPTAYYLTCPHLVHQIDRLESAGGVRRYERQLQEDDSLLTSTRRAHARHAALGDRGVGIAGTSDERRVKCLHAHAAFALAEDDHPLGSAVVREASPRWCADGRCVAFAEGNGSPTPNPEV